MAAPLLEAAVLPEEEYLAVGREAVHSRAFLLMRNRVRISGNRPGPLEAFLRLYGRLAVPGISEGPDIDIRYRLADEPAGTWATFTVNDEAYRLSGAVLPEHIPAAIIHLVLSNIRSHFIIHGGCVSREGQCVIIAGDSGMGKSTLSAHLAAAGLDFLSDELAPIHRATGLVDPVPLRIGIRPGPGEALLSGKDFLLLDDRDDRKSLVDVAALTGREAGGPARLAAVVFLTGEAGPRVATPKSFRETVRVTLTGTSEPFERDLLALAGVRLVEKGRRLELPSFTMRTDQPADFLPALRRILDAHGFSLAELRYEDLDPPDFSGHPEISRLPAASGVLELWKKMPGHHKGNLIRREFGGSAAGTMRELARLLEQTSFHRLKPGRLEEMIPLVAGLIR